MFSFVDAASEHAYALLHFHNYAMFFLVLVIVFVIWVLKMVLKFFVIERDLTGEFASKGTNVIFSFGLVFSLFEQFSSFLMDIFYSIFLVLNATKTVYAHTLTETMYPDQGKKINIFYIFPRLINVKHAYRSAYPAGTVFFYNYLSFIKPKSLASVFDIYHTLLRDVPFLFPFYRIDIPVSSIDRLYESVEMFLNLHLFTTSYSVFLKHSTWDNFFKFHSFSRKEKWAYKVFNTKAFLGYNAGNRLAFYKPYSRAFTPFFMFAKFYGTEIRTFFYLFFQHVRHRKVLEWVWTCIPALILLLLLYPSLLLLYCYDRPYITRPYLTFKAIGHQWYWSYEYSDFTYTTDVLTNPIKFDSYMIHQNDLALGEFRLLEVDRRIILPVGVCMRLITTSSDVLHSWSVSALGVKIDAVPGRLNQFWVVTDRPGTFYGQCSELCGVNHGFMPIVVECALFKTVFKALLLAAEL